MRLKTNRRLVLLGTAVAAVLAGGFFVAVVRPWQKQRMSGEFFEKGQQAFKEKDYFNALGATAQFISRLQNDRAKLNDPRYPDALLVYAESRRNIEEANGSHLQQCKSWYQQYLDLRPDDVAARKTLLKVLNELGQGLEAKETAEKLLPKDLAQAKTEDVPVLRELALAQLMLATQKKDLADAGLTRTLDRLLALAPLDLHGNLYRFIADGETGRKAEARARAERLLSEHPDRPEALVIAAYSRQVDPRGADLMERHEYLCRAAGLDPKTAARTAAATYPSEDYALDLVSAFDRLNSFEFSLAVLRDAADRVKGPKLELALVRRLWQEIEHDTIIARTASLDPASREVHTDLLGFRALALQRAGKSAEVAPILAGLATREGDFRAGGWLAALELTDPAKTIEPLKAVEGWQAAVDSKKNPIEPVFWANLGLALSAAGREDEARKAWDQARILPIAASWFFPSLRIAESYLAEGRAEEAARAADQAVMVSPNRVTVVALWFEAQTARIQRGSTEPPTPRSILSKLEEAIPMIAKVPGDTGRQLLDRLVIPHVLLLARDGRTEDAKRVGMEAVGSSSSPALLQRLAQLSSEERLGIEDACMARVEALTGVTASVVLVKAIELADAGDPDAGLALIEQQIQKKPQDADFQFARARYLERLGRPTALQAWMALGDAYPDDLNVQKVCLQSPAAAADRAFIERTIQRYAKLLGAEPGAAEGVAYTARARSLMFGAPTKADRDQAVSLLSAVAAAAPRLAEPKFLLAGALSYADPSRDIKPDHSRASTLLTEAATLEPRNVQVQLALARSLQQQRAFDRARDILQRLAADSTFDAPTRRAAAELLIGQGEPGPVASSVLAELVASAGAKADPLVMVLLAEAYLAQNQDAKAAELYERLAAGDARDADSIFMTARFFTSRNDKAKADAVIKRLETLTLAPGLRDYALARLADDRQDVTAALAHYEAAVRDLPGRADVWRQYCALLIRAGKTEEASAAAKRGSQANPGDAGLRALVEQTAVIAGGGGNIEIKDLIRALVMDPSLGDAADALRQLEASMSRNEAITPDALVAIADRAPNSVPLQLFVARRLAPIAPDRAVVIATRAMNAAPTDPAPARAAAELYVGLGRWGDLLSAATEWQKRDTSRPIDADVAIAQAHLGLGQFDRGLQALASRVGPAAQAPTLAGSLAVLNINTRLLIGAGREAEARRLLSPLLPTSATLRSVIWVGAATEAVPNVATARAWLEELAAAIPADAADEKLTLASAYAALASRFPEQGEAMLRAAMDIAESLTAESGPIAARAWESLGILRHRRGDLAGAETAYRKAIELDPANATSLNNLASILLETHGKPADALPFAQRAAEIAPSTYSLDTLAAVNAKLGEAAQARNDPAQKDFFRAAGEAYKRIAPYSVNDPRPFLNASVMFERVQDFAQAAECYESILLYQGLPSSITAGVKNNLAMALVRMNRSKPDLERAVVLASEATKITDQPGYLDTLGWACVAAGRGDEAIEAFRSALRKAAAGRQKLDSATIGMATVMASRSPEDRAEAGRLLDSIDASKLETEDAERMKKARELIASPR